jgi:hypothetical protein
VSSCCYLFYLFGKKCVKSNKKIELKDKGKSLPPKQFLMCNLMCNGDRNFSEHWQKFKRDDKQIYNNTVQTQTRGNKPRTKRIFKTEAWFELNRSIFLQSTLLSLRSF